MIAIVESSLKQAQSCLERLLSDKAMLARIAEAGTMMATAFQKGARLYSCGNGGSMCDAMHLAEELTGRYRDNRPPLGAAAIADGSHLSCTANDFGYDQVFSRYIGGHGRAGDILVAISTSGKSANIVEALKTARTLGLKTISLTGKKNSLVGGLADIDICTPGFQYADRVQELHIKVIHTLIEIVERHLFPENYKEP